MAHSTHGQLNSLNCLKNTTEIVHMLYARCSEAIKSSAMLLDVLHLEMCMCDFGVIIIGVIYCVVRRSCFIVCSWCFCHLDAVFHCSHCFFNAFFKISHPQKKESQWVWKNKRMSKQWHSFLFGELFLLRNYSPDGQNERVCENNRGAERTFEPQRW